MPDDIVGRGGELATIEAFLDRAALGPAALVVHGEAGIGKTTLVHAALDGASRRGFLVLRTQPAESERELTLVGLTDLFAAIGQEHLAALPPPQRRALEVALLRAGGDAVADQLALSVATGGLLRSLSAVTPVLLAIDDAQWLDDSTSAILAYALRRLDDARVSIVCAFRSALPAGRAAALTAALDAAVTERVDVGPLPLAAMHRLFEARLGRSFSRLALVRIEEASGGNPFFALEIARALARSGETIGPGEKLPVPDTLAELMDSRIRALPAATRHALLLTAAAAEPTVETLCRADPAYADAIVPAADDRIVRFEGDVVRFTHPLLAQAALARGSATGLRQAHVLLATAVGSDEARARHLGQAVEGPDATVATALERAADAARTRGATLDASSLYREAARLTPSDLSEERMRRALLAAECLFVDISEIVQADAILEEAIPAAPHGPARAEGLSLRALLRYYHGHTPEGVALGEQAVREAVESDADPVLRARVLVRLAFLLMQVDLDRGLEANEEAVRLLERELARDPAAVDPDLMSYALLLRANAEFGLVRGMRRDQIERGLALMTANGRSWEHEGADGMAFGLARHTDDLDRAIRMTRDLIEAKAGPGGNDPFNLVQLAGLLCLRGEWREARATAEAALEGYAREGASVFPAWGLRGVAMVAAHDGRVEDARRWAAEGLDLATQAGNDVVATFHRQILGFVALTIGDAAEADRQLTAAADLAERMGTRHPGRFKLDGDRVEAALAIGDREKAAAIVERLEHAGRVAPTPWTLAVGARCRGLLEADRGNSDAAAAAFERAMREHDELPMPFERARTLLAKGQLHRRRKEKRLADECLRHALGVFEALGAPAWADRARAELGRIGLRPRAPEGLTQTERRVAELAALGLSSREIAARAFLAPKTASNVLGRVYEKLNIHSRAELGAVMAGEAAGRAASVSGVPGVSGVSTVPLGEPGTPGAGAVMPLRGPGAAARHRSG